MMGPDVSLRPGDSAQSRMVRLLQRDDFCSALGRSERNMQFKARTADTQPHCTTTADFLASMQKELAGMFHDALVSADVSGLIGKETFAIDGCKPSSNASERWNGTPGELRKKQPKYEALIIPVRFSLTDTWSSKAELKWKFSTRYLPRGSCLNSVVV